VQGQRDHPVALEAAAAKIGRDSSPHVGERGRHLQHPVELLLVTVLLPLLVVEVLAAARRIGSERLDVPVRVRADPHVLPRGRDHQVINALQGRPVGYRCAVLILIGKALPAAHPTDPGVADSATAKSHV
jgi:hypothetical protein